MSKFSNVKLLLILVVLGAGFGIAKYLQSKKGERNFRSELVKIDSAKVSTFLIYPKSKKGEEVKLFKEGDGWKVRISENKSLSVEGEKIAGLIKTVSEMKPTRLAARSSDKWQEFEVDTNGTHVIVKEGDKKVLDAVIGKFSFSGGRNVETYVRLTGEDETYTVNGFLEGTFNSGIEAWRDKTIAKGNKEDWTKISFSISDTVRYELVRGDTSWIIGDMPANKTEVDDYLNELANLSGFAFADDVDINTLGSPQNVVEVYDSSTVAVKVEGFVLGDKKIIRSSLNADNIFTDQGGLFEKVFAGVGRFLPIAAEATN